MRGINKVLFLAAAVSLMFAAAASAAWKWPWQQQKSNVVSIQGSTTNLPITQKAAEDYMKVNKDIEISVRGGGSGVGIAGIIDGACDIGNSSRAIKSKEIMNARAKGVNPHETVIARDGMAIVVHPSNSLKNITVDQIQAIYTGQIKRWSQLGGADEPIVVVSRDTSSGTYEVFNELVLKGSKLRTDCIMTVSNREVAETVKNTNGAIGYVGLAFLSDGLNTVTVEGITASNATINNKTYKLARELYVYTNGPPAGNAKAFIDYILSEAGQKIVADVGYVPLR
ncbi:MAG TPA: PstS family phosphate ABC transporter substrate-binding protein [bacterium]|nr:PstS family phosphate ABC transporter substrate-binding protein [bacterium]